MTVTADAGFVAEGVGQRLSQGNAYILNGVMSVDLQIAFGPDGQVEEAVTRYLIEHVFKERHTDLQIRFAGAVQVQFYLDTGLSGMALNSGCSSGHLFFTLSLQAHSIPLAASAEQARIRRNGACSTEYEFPDAVPATGSVYIIVNMIDDVKHYLLKLQNRISEALRDLDPEVSYREDRWQRPQGGGGISRIFQQGEVVEKGGINFSHVAGESLPPSASAQRPELAGRSFQALGDSLVIHPLNPYVPTTHMNIRFFLAEKPGADPVWWFGGGFDLTPYYGFEEDARHWHETARKACAPFGDDVYPGYKKWCDDYFYLQHRNEPRGIGGLFFDDLNAWGFERCFGFMQSVGDHFLDAYLPIVERRHDTPWGDRQRQFQLYRRGRYVEFNLVYDRGTLFGLQSGGRTESILMSLPPLVRWDYDWQPQAGSEEERLYRDFLQARDWLTR